MRSFSWSSRRFTISIVLIFAYFIWNLFPEQLGNYSTRDVSISLHIAGIIIGILARYIFLVYFERITYFHREKDVISDKLPGKVTHERVLYLLYYGKYFRGCADKAHSFENVVYGIVMLLS